MLNKGPRLERALVSDWWTLDPGDDKIEYRSNNLKVPLLAGAFLLKYHKST